MRVGLCGLAVLLLSWPAKAQSGGVPPEWEVRQDMATLCEHVQRFKPLVDQAKPGNWRGAPAAYVDQGQRVSAETEYLIGAAQTLAGHPQTLTSALTTYFRMQSVDLMLRSYTEGIRKYQSPALAEQLLVALTVAAADREKLRQYIVDLAADKEQECRVMDEEAQRCRGQLSRESRGVPKAGSKPQKEVHQ
jgi:hypothetical protein